MSAADAIAPTAEHPSPVEEKPAITSVSKTELDEEPPRKRRLGELGPTALIFACGTALFSDGYINASAGPVNTMLKMIYADFPGVKHQTSLFSSLAFAGTVCGMLIFGLVSDRIGRKVGMVFCSLWLVLFSILIAGSWGAGGSVGGLFAALQAYRFLLGIGIGGEYPSGSVASAEGTESKGVNPKRTQSLFIFATNTAIDFGFVIAPMVSAILLEIFGERHLVWVWRLTLGLGAIPPAVVLFFRVRMPEPEQYKRGAIRHRLPWLLIVKRYGVRLAAVSVSWFAYDFVSYPASILSSLFFARLVGDNLQKSLWYSVAVNCFYLPGTLIGALVADRLGPKYTMISALLVQAAFGFGLAGGFGQLRDNITGVIILYGCFVAAGEAGPGNNLGLLASKAVSPTATRGTFYGIAAAIGKIGAFSATYAFDSIQSGVSGGNTDADIAYAAQFYIGSALAVFSAAIVWLFIPPVTHDSLARMDAEFEAYLAENGYDMSLIGLKKTTSLESEGRGSDEKASR